MTRRESVRSGNATIDYEFRRSQRRSKTVEITVDLNGVQVAAPSTAPDDVKAIVRKRARRISGHATGILIESAPKRFVSGETLPYLGRNVRVIVVPKDDRHTSVHFDHWSFRVAVSRSLAREARREELRRAFVARYRARASERPRAR